MILSRLFKKKTETKDTELLAYDPYCPECNSDIGADTNGMIKFCPECGAELKQPFRCAICNTPINATAKYCTGCGNIALKLMP